MVGISIYCIYIMGWRCLDSFQGVVLVEVPRDCLVIINRASCWAVLMDGILSSILRIELGGKCFVVTYLSVLYGVFGDLTTAFAFALLMILTLPFELRALIWNHVFIIPEPTVQLRLSPHTARNTSVLRVLTVCKTIHREALHIFYRHNRLLLATPAALFLFLSSLQRSRRTQITALTVAGFGLHYTGYQCAAQAFSMLQLCSNLTDFQLKVAPEHSWDILEVAPWRPEDSWYELQWALDCLGNLRGLQSGSIMGIDPLFGHAFVGIALTCYEEDRGPRAMELKAAWLRPRVLRNSSRHNNLL